MIVKQRFSKDPVTGLPLEVDIMDARGKKVFEQKMALPESHFFELDFPLSETAATGQYEILLYTGKEILLGSKSVHVQEFLPDRLKIEALFTPDDHLAWLKPEGLLPE